MIPTLLALALCGLSVINQAECTPTGEASITVLARTVGPHELRNRLGTRIGFVSRRSWRGFVVRGEVSARWDVWLFAPWRPCGSHLPEGTPPDCVGLFHVENIAAVEQHHTYEFTAGYKGITAGVAWQRRSINWPHFEGAQGDWPTFVECKQDTQSSSSDYDERCYLAAPLTLWGGFGASDGLAYVLRYDAPWIALRIHRRYTNEHTSLPTERWGVRLRAQWRDIAVDARVLGGGLRRTVGDVRLRWKYFALGAGRYAYPVPGSVFDTVAGSVILTW